METNTALEVFQTIAALFVFIKFLVLGDYENKGLIRIVRENKKNEQGTR